MNICAMFKQISVPWRPLAFDFVQGLPWVSESVSNIISCIINNKVKALNTMYPKLVGF